jgi:hypothetical protein
LTKKTNVYKLIDEKFQIVKAAKARKKTVSKLIIDDWDHAIEIIETNVVRKTDEVTPDLRSSTTGSSTLTTTFPNRCTVTSSSENICAKSKRIGVEVHTDRAEYEELDLEQ